MKGARADVAERLRWQAEWCGKLGSPLYEDLLGHAAADVERGGPVWDVLSDPRSDVPDRDGALPGAQALRLMGAVHRLVLSGRAPELARFYPSAGGVPGGGVHEAFGAVLEHRRTEVIELIDHPVQTNEPGRSAALLCGFLELVRTTGLPLRTLEVGASAGLNLRWDKYFYAGAGASWGDPRSPVRFEDAFEGEQPPLHVSVEVAERRGCDMDPLDPASEEDRLTLLSYVWPDQDHRFRPLRAALELAPETPAPIDRADAGEWTATMLAEPPAGPHHGRVPFCRSPIPGRTGHRSAEGGDRGRGRTRHRRRAARMAQHGGGRAAGRGSPHDLARRRVTRARPRELPRPTGELVGLVRG